MWNSRGAAGKSIRDIVQLLMRCFKVVVGMCKISYGIFRGRIKGDSAGGTIVREKVIKGLALGNSWLVSTLVC